MIQKFKDYLTGITVVGLVALGSLILHTLYPRHGNPGHLFDAAFCISWTTLMAVFAPVFAIWVFLIYKPNKNKN